MSDARQAAVRIIGRVMRSGAYSNVVLPHETADLDKRDRRHAQYLAYGVLRHLDRLDRIIDGYSQRPAIEPEVRDVLRLGAFELLESRTPSHAAIDSAVGTVRSLGYHRATGFVNAILRSIDRHGDPDPGVASALPGWLTDSLVEAWGPEEAAEFTAASMTDAPLTVRARPGAAAEGLEPVSSIPGAYQAETVGPGLMVQDGASIAVGLAAAIQPGEVVYDMAAAPGGKALHAYDALAGTGLLVLGDRHPRRMASARRRLAKAGADVPWVLADARRTPFADDTFEVVLLDAPCSGLGTLRRRPEIKHRSKPEDITRMAGFQTLMLDEAVRITKSGGRVVYSVCTVTPSETIDVVAAHEASPPAGLPGRTWGKGLLLGPHLTGTDGMFISIVSVT